MLVFLSVAILIYGSMHLYAFGKVWLAFPHSIGLGLALMLAGIVLTLLPFLVWYLEKQHWHSTAIAAAWVSYPWMGFVFLFFSIGLTLDLAHLLATLLRFEWPLNDASGFRIVGLLALAAMGYGLIEARQIKVEEVTIATPKLASGSVTLAQISDLHLGLMQGESFLERVTAKLRELKPDILVATGDIVDGQGDDLDALARSFRHCTSAQPSYAVIGNHESFAGLENSLCFLHDAGFTVLRGDSAQEDGITLVGVDDPAAGFQRAPDKAIAGKLLAAQDFIILLKHQPVVDGDIPFDLQLSGHIHGGQIFPFEYLTRLTYRVHTGLTELGDGRRLYVSRGAGTWGPPIRLFAPPEITLITIRSTATEFDRITGRPK